MRSFFEEFVSQIKIENYIKNIKERKVIIWGASEAGKSLYDILLEKKLEVHAFVDNKAGNFGGKFNRIKINTPEFLRKNKEKYYIFIAANYHKEIEVFLNNNSYLEIEDYLYIIHKPIKIEKNEEYKDIYGNTIKGERGANINFIGYNSALKINSDCNIGSNNEIICCNSVINIDSNSNLGENINIICINSNINIGPRCNFGENINITCINGSISIGEECIVEEHSSIYCNDNSNINISLQCQLSEKLEIFCQKNSIINIGTKCIIEECTSIYCNYNSNLSIGECCTFGLSFFGFSYYHGRVKIGDDCMIANYVTIVNNDGHPIFDINSKAQLNTNKFITIGNHVWLGNKCTMVSRSDIGDGSIVGANSLVSKKFPNNCIIAGNPAKLKRRDIAWDRNQINIDLIDKTLYWNKTIK